MSCDLEFRIEKLKSRPLQIEFDESIEVFPQLQEPDGQVDATFLGRVSGRLTATLASGVIEVDGMVSTRVQQPCSRCLLPVESAVALQVALTYVPSDAGAERSAEIEKELSTEELGLIRCPVDVLDLHPELAQEILMALPQQPLCSQGCAGLCPVCGQNRNQGDCQCERPVFHDGLAALKNFKVEKS